MGTSLAQSMEHGTLELRVMVSSPRLGVEITKKIILKKCRINKQKMSEDHCSSLLEYFYSQNSQQLSV